MKKHDTTNDRLDSMLGDALGDSAVPDAGRSVWFEVRDRTVAPRRRVWAPRFAMAAAAAVCMTVGFLAGAEWLPGEATDSNWLLPDEVVAGSLWDETSWSLDGLYASVETSIATDGGAE